MENKLKRKLRVAWTSNPPWTPSGYSQQTADIEKLFLASGWDQSNFALINMFGQHGGKFKDEFGIWNYPLINHPIGSDAMLQHGAHFRPDIMIGLFDIWGANPEDLAKLTRFVPYVPIDTQPIQPAMLSNLRFANRIIAMSKFGQQELKKNGFASYHIPHHVDTSIFKPLDKKQARAAFGLPQDAFVFGMVSANKDILPRKAFGQVLEAFGEFVKKYPNSYLYIHTNPDQPGGYPLRLHSGQLGIERNMIYPDLYKWQFDIPKEDMAKIYALFDVLLLPSSTEGFAIPIIEAQACGVPVIVNDYTSMPELVVDRVTGYITKTHKKLEDSGCAHLMPNGQYMRFPDPKDLYDKMIYIKGIKLEVMGEAARKHAVKSFDMQMVWAKYWLPFLLRYELEIYSPQLLTSA